MKKYETQEETVVTKEVCVKMTCDLCKRGAECPADEIFEWGGAGTGVGDLSWHRTIDGEYDPESRELCYECASALALAFKTHSRELLKVCKMANRMFLKAILNT